MYIDTEILLCEQPEVVERFQVSSSWQPEHTECSTKINHLPSEIFESIFQLTSASQHAIFSGVCKHWNDILNDPLLKRHVLLDFTNMEPAWKAHLGRVFAINAASNSTSALQAYGHVLVRWMAQFVSSHTRILVISEGLCSHSFIFWRELRQLLEHECPRLRRITFQSGQVFVSVLKDLPATVTSVRLDNVRVMKRHEEENYTECLFDLRQTFRDLDLTAILQRKEENNSKPHEASLEDCFL